MEFGIVLGFAYWGYKAGTTTMIKILLAILVPLSAFAFWGLVDFRHAGRFAEILRLIQELAISGLAAVTVGLAGQPVLGWILAVVSIVHHIMVYAIGEKLLKH